ncbi:hypothetical protein [Vibrio alfacsensis]|uniref:hypothetical protein n=1 Tax=Vibrio alfacsensis TaxID=1074311 RepID=UPI00406812CB
MKANVVTDKKEHLEDMLLAVEEPILDIDNILDSLSGDEAAVRFCLNFLYMTTPLMGGSSGS